jgi:hypothetical protein
MRIFVEISHGFIRVRTADFSMLCEYMAIGSMHAVWAGSSPSVIGASVDLSAHHLNGRYERTNAFIVPQRFPKDRPKGEIEYRPTDAGTIKVSA